jgi:hypothetical protein
MFDTNQYINEMRIRVAIYIEFMFDTNQYTNEMRIRVAIHTENTNIWFSMKVPVLALSVQFFLAILLAIRIT